MCAHACMYPLGPETSNLHGSEVTGSFESSAVSGRNQTTKLKSSAGTVYYLTFELSLPINPIIKYIYNFTVFTKLNLSMGT